MDWLRKGRLQSSYQPVSKDEIREEHELQETSSQQDERQARRLRRARWIIGTVPILFILIIVLGAFVHDTIYHKSLDTATPPDRGNTNTTVNEHHNSCPRRREWRTLSDNDKEAYITAAKCLLTQPSVLHLQTQNTSAYSDFPYIHAHVGYRTHHSAPFLPWHRYLLSIYETTLRQSCNYTGGLVYWDWTQDATDLTSSPVFDPATGFGGDGDPNGNITVGRHGRCVLDGPFAGIEALWYDVKYQPHCLSRGFRSDDGVGAMDGTNVSPESINRTLALGSYEEFVDEMEAKVHDAIPFGIGGDFETFTAPFDPLFYLHHVQLDRLWWLWQHSAPDDSRVLAYGGRNGRHSIESAKLSDKIGMGALATPISVRQVMDTSGGSNMLCYSY